MFLTDRSCGASLLLVGRTRSFEEPATLRAAAEAFRSRGYEGTSIDDLVAALHLHRGSLYNAYGSKRGLFLAALRHHLDALLAVPGLATGTSSAAEGENAELQSIDRSLSLDLLLVAAVERGPVDSEVAELVRTTLERLDGALVAGAQAPPAPVGPALTVLAHRLLQRLIPEDAAPATPPRSAHGNRHDPR